MRQDGQPVIPGLPSEASAPAGEGSTLQPDGAGATPSGPPPGGGGSGLFLFLPLILIFVLMIFLSGRAQKKEQKRKQELLAALKKHDRVQTIGGIIGSISEVRDEEIILIIDEQDKTRLRVAKAAIQQVLREAPGGGVEGSTAEPSLAVGTAS
ncbi:MAG: preprotein translocase subunit YajC [Planctomycetota bacterium]